MKPATVGLLGALALVVSFQLGRESVKAEIRDVFVRAFAGAGTALADARRPFRVYAGDIISRTTDGRPHMINCPKCAGYPRFQGIDPYDRTPITCEQCSGQGITDVRTMLRPVVEVQPPEPTDYAEPPRWRR